MSESIPLEAKSTPTVPHGDDAGNEAMLGHLRHLKIRERFQLCELQIKNILAETSRHVGLEHVYRPSKGK